MGLGDSQVKSWLSAAEIAALALPGLPTTTYGMQLFAQRNGWTGRPREGRGGGVEYAIDILPAAARTAYVARHIGAIEVPLPLAREAAAEPEAASLNGAATEARDARLALLALADKVAAQAKAGRKVADRQFCDLYNTGVLEAASWIRQQVKAVTPRTLARWRAHARDGRTARLAVDRAASRKGQGALDRANGGAVKTFILALLAKQPQLTAHHIRDLVADRFEGQLTLGQKATAIPPIRSFQYALKAWRTEYRNELHAVRNPDSYKSTVRFTARVARPAERLNQLWQIDASPADAICLDGRHSVYVCVDIFSRRLVALVTKTPRAAAVGLMLRKAILAWGVPERIKTDNGSDFIARASRQLLDALGVERETAQAFSPEQKGHIERAIGTMQRDLMRTLPGFAGHSVADRQEIRARQSFARRLGQDADDAFAVALTAAELQRHADNWCADIYGHKPHASLGGQSPFAVAAGAAATIKTVDARALDMLLAPVVGKDGIRTVTKSGIRTPDGFYIAGFLNVGDQVLVRQDPSDLGRVYVFDRDGAAFFGEAICPDLAGLNPAAAIAAVRAEQKRIVDENLAPARAEARRIKVADIAPALHRQALAKTGKLVEFPKRSETHETPSIAAARAAAEGASIEPVHSAETLALHAQLKAEAAANVVTLREEETSHHRWNRARAFEAALARGEAIAPDDLLWLGGYREGPEYRGFALTYGVPSVTENEQRPAFEAGR